MNHLILQFSKNIFTTEAQRTRRKTLENWNDGILEKLFVFPTIPLFHYSILFYSFNLWVLCVSVVN